MNRKQTSGIHRTLGDFLHGKSDHTMMLFNHFIEHYNKIGKITLHPAKTMIAIVSQQKCIAYVTQLGKNFIHIVFPFEKSYSDNLCFQKIAKVPGDVRQFNHHFRMCDREDVNEEVLKFMRLAFPDSFD